MQTHRPTPARRRRGALLAAALAVLMAPVAALPPAAATAVGTVAVGPAGDVADRGEPAPAGEPEETGESAASVPGETAAGPHEADARQGGSDPEPGGTEPERGAANPAPDGTDPVPGAAEPGRSEGEPGVDPERVDADGRQWIDRPTRVELDEDTRNAPIRALHCRALNQGRGDRVELWRWLETGWAVVAEQFLDSSRMCETVEWTIFDVRRGLGGWFAMATLQGSTQVDWLQFQLVVRLKPSVITHPTSGTVGLGGRLTLTSTGRYGTEWPDPTVQWESSPDGRTWTPIDGATGSVYQTLPATAEMDGMRYRAVHHRIRMEIHESGGEAVSNVATLTVRQAPTINPQPADAAGPRGAPAAFEAAAVGAPVPTVQWESAPPGGSFTPVPGATTGRLEVPDVRADQDGTRYRAVFTNTQGVRTTREAVLTVLLPPEIVEHPRDVVALRGQPVSFTVAAEGVETWRWQWQPPGSADEDRWVTHSSAWTPTYSVTAGPLTDGMRVRAMVTGPGGTTYSDPATLTVLVLPPVHVSVEARTRVVPALPGW
jgi:hypothetical protein